MARTVVWTSRAERIFTSILEYYVDRNNSKKYSRTLNTKVNTATNLLSKYPNLGFKTEIEDVRVFIKDNYKIFYLVTKSKIVVLLVWDSRQFPINITNLLKL